MLYAIGDVHGCYKSLVALLKKINPKVSDEVYFVGDAVNKGVDSAKVMKLIREQGYQLVLGNHEKMVLEGFKDGKLTKEFVHSYRGKEVQLLDDIAFMRAAPTYVLGKKDEQGRKLIITHGYGHSLFGKYRLGSKEFNEKIIKERIPPDLTPQKVAKLDSFYFNIFGHIPLSKPLISPCMVGIDTGCYAGNYLCAFSFPEKKIFLQRSLG
ncbi:hypothetical protein CCZ01_06445 [Helicobacter monodelphidis]|uniref:metallophosphoesterase n=1 Tax=Helicobacter sp. 15-1451 TaxID=2004995 RepID=UPI000DCBB337|nr:metallophosphoesterase [Helicobacter sp. 15-1451]RAX57334.1 hypothetical protein CCZ01_06445 [Helicobacter sp. 15-1451]